MEICKEENKRKNLFIFFYIKIHRISTCDKYESNELKKITSYLQKYQFSTEIEITSVLWMKKYPYNPLSEVRYFEEI